METLKYVQPTAAEVKEMTLDQAQKIDQQNKTIFERNKKIAEAAKLILLDVEPTNRKLRELEIPGPAHSFVDIVTDRLEREAQEAEKAAQAKPKA